MGSVCHRAERGYYFVRYTDEDGKVRQKKAFPQRRASERLLAQTEAEVRAKVEERRLGRQRAREAIGALTAGYLAYLEERGRNERYVRGVAAMLRAFVAFEGTPADVGDLTNEHAEAYLRSLKLAPATVNRHRASIVAFGRFLERRGHVPKHPFNDIPQRNENAGRTKRRAALTRDQVQRLIETADAHPDVTLEDLPNGVKKDGTPRIARRRISMPHRGLLYRTLVGSGLRVSEAASCRVEHTKAGPALVARRKARSVETHQPIDQALARTIEEVAGEEGNPWGDYDLAQLPRVLRQDAERCRLALPGLDVHWFRHTYCSWLAAAGTNAAVLRDLAGHRSLATTMNFYTHAQSDDVTRAVTAVAV